MDAKIALPKLPVHKRAGLLEILEERRAEVLRAFFEAHDEPSPARVAAATALLLDRIQEVAGPVTVVSEEAARRLAADMLECSPR